MSCFAGNNGGLSLAHLVSLCDAPLTLLPGFRLGSRTYMSTNVEHAIYIPQITGPYYDRICVTIVSMIVKYITYYLL